MENEKKKRFNFENPGKRQTKESEDKKDVRYQGEPEIAPNCA